MQFIEHRKNAIADLELTDPRHGVEIDIRSDIHSQGTLYTGHDAFKPVHPLDAWLKAYKARRHQGPLILNTKEDLLEKPLLELLQKHKISNYYFLDTTIPTLYKYRNSPEIGHFMLRLSRLEALENWQSFIHKVSVLWVDCFEGSAIDLSIAQEARKHFQLCLVSPELHGYPLKDRILEFKDLAGTAQMICTKDPGAWQSLLPSL